MSKVFGNNFTKCLSKIFLSFIFIFCSIVFVACNDDYSNMSITLSNNGGEVILYLNDDVSTTQTVVVTVNAGVNIDKHIEVSVESNLISIAKEFDGENTTITLSALGVCKNVPVNVSTVEGGKTAVFYVSVIIPISILTETDDSDNLYAVKGEAKNLNVNELVSFSPENTTQKEVVFSLKSPISTVSLANNVLTIGEDYDADTLTLVATSTVDESIKTEIVLNVLEPINSDMVSFSAIYPSHTQTIDLQDGIQLGKNVDTKNNVDLTVTINTIKDIVITPVINSTLSLKSNIASVITYTKTVNSTDTVYVFTINAEGSNGDDAIFFEISYTDYNYKYKTQLFNITAYDAVSDIDYFVDGVAPEDFHFTVYDSYFETYGMEIVAIAKPLTVPVSESQLTLTLLTSASDYDFYTQTGQLISFEGNTYTYYSGEKLYVKAKTQTSSDAQFSISSNSNSELSQIFNISAEAGETAIQFVNSQIVGTNPYYYYLTTNESMQQKIIFNIASSTSEKITISSSGTGFTVDSELHPDDTFGNYYFYINSVAGSKNSVGTLTIKAGNGLSITAKVETFEELDSTIALSVPSSQTNSAVGQVSILPETTLESTVYNTQFSVAVKTGNSITLTKSGKGILGVNYTYYDYALGTNSAYDEFYIDFSTFTGSMATNVNYKSYSNIIRPIYLTSFSQIYAENVGKVWVKVEISGNSLIDGIKTANTVTYYFMVECYQPIQSFTLSNTAINLYAKNSVGEDDYDLTSKIVDVYLTSNTTYNEIVWSNTYGLDYTLNNQKVYTFTDNISSVKVDAFSTMGSYQSEGETLFANKDSLTFYFVAKIVEFNKIYSVSLKVNILKAQQVENILVENVNIDNGIYIELDYSGQAITYQIQARAQKGENGIEPFNNKLIYTFIQNGASSSSILSMNSLSGLITILNGENAIGGSGVIRIAPADRYVDGQYVAGDNDVAVYIKIAIADGRTRESSFRITSLSEIDNLNLHYTLMLSDTISSEETYGISDTFNGGLYGSLIGQTNYATITTNKTLFGVLSANAIIKDLVVVGNISDSGNGFIADENNGQITNVTIDTQTDENGYFASSLAVANSSSVGGIAGINKGDIISCNFYGEITAVSTVGGIAGNNSGDIDSCKVEFYNFKHNDITSYASISGGEFVGGLVGQMIGGTLTQSYVYSYAYTDDGTKNYMGLNVLSGTNVGGLVGELTGGSINICFANVNDVSTLTGNAFTSGEIINAYVIYRATNDTKEASYTVNKTPDYNYNSITSNTIWTVNASKNDGFPFFKAILQADAISEITDTLTASLENVISKAGTSIIYYYASSLTLTEQELVTLSNLNSISFSDILGSDATGVRALTSNKNVVSVSSNGITIKNIGFATITLFSKYDFSIAQTYTIYVIYPILNLSLNYDTYQFGDGSTINVKISDGFSLRGSIDDSVLLVSRDILLKTNSLTLNLNSNTENAYTTFITGSGLGAYTFNTQGLFDLENSSNIVINYTLTLNSTTFATDKLSEINLMLETYFSSQFTINLYKGADDVTISSSNAEMEPNDVYSFESSIFSDLAYTESGISEEDIVVSIDTNDYSSDLFTTTVTYLETVYYLDKNDLSQTTTNENLAVYYQHKFSISIKVKDEYKHLAFNGEHFEVSVIAKSSQTNSVEYNSQIVEKVFDLVVNSQSILSVNATHYALLPNGKTLVNLNQVNYVYYEYSTQSNSVLTPGDEGLLAINIYPIFANYEYLTITYMTTTGESTNLRLGIMNKESSGKYSKSSVGYQTLENGIKVYNLYSYSSLQNNLKTLYLSTYIPDDIEKDTIFILTIKAYNENDEVVSQAINFNLVVQYLEGAEISVQNSEGEDLTTVARGSEEYLVITIQKDQTVDLDNIVISGRVYDSLVDNYLTYSGFTVTEDAYSTTQTYTASLYIGSALKIEDNANYVTIGVSVSWVINGKTQTKTNYFTLGVVDFLIDDVALLTDKTDKTNLKAYIGIQTALQFDFSEDESNLALQEFLTNYYYESLSGVNSFGDYIVNYGNENAGSFMANLYYVSGNNYSQILGSNGILQANSYFNFAVEDDGLIKITGKKSGVVNLMLRIQVKMPSDTSVVIKYVDFLFSITVNIYSDEDTPLVIDSETAFYDAINGEVAQNYILMSDLNLTGYSPVDTDGIASLDGNNYTINIKSWDTDTTDIELNLALFETVNSYTTLKNLIVNVYHSSNIVVDTTEHTTINVAGITITNDGVIYNCAVVAYKTDTSLPTYSGTAGFNLSYSVGQITDTITSKLAGFVITNNGYITNSRVGGDSVTYVDKGEVNLGTFNLAAQGNICGFVYENSGIIASSYFANGTITNTTTSGLTTYTSGFVGTNNGEINLSYAKGVGENEFSLSDGGITTSSVSAGFAYNNSGDISDSYSNIMLATSNSSTQTLYASGRLTSGFAYKNNGNIERCFTASKIEDAKTTQMNFIGVDNFGEMQNTGTITNSYYYNLNSDLDDAYSSTNSDISVTRITEPDLTDSYYGFTFADSASSINGVWFITAYGIDLVSANQIAVSNRYIANEVRDEITNELVSYSLPYTTGYDYGSKNNPIIIREASEFNLVFGGDDENAGTAISSYYDLESQTIFGNYRIVTDIDLTELITDSTSGVKISSSSMALVGGIIDGNSFEISGLELVAKAESTIKNYGMFASITDSSILMNIKIEVIAVNAVTVQNVGSVAGVLKESKLINLSLYSKDIDETATIVGNNIVGGVVGKVLGESEVKNISINNINVTANYIASGTAQYFIRDESTISSANKYLSYAGGIAGVVDIYENDEITNFVHDENMSKPQLAFLKVSGSMTISGSTVGGLLGYMGPSTYLKDATLELSSKLDQKLISYYYYAGGIVGENYGDLDMARTQHDEKTQTAIEAQVATYYKNPSSTTVQRGNLSLFEHSSIGDYEPIAIGGLVGAMVSGNISHSYSKVNVRNSNVLYAGGIIGYIPFATNTIQNYIDLYEVYAFGDVLASTDESKVSGAGGILGYIDFTRTININRVNAVNYWSLAFDTETNTYYLPNNIYDIYAVTGNKNANISAKTLNTLVTENNDTISINSTYLSTYKLPKITCSVNSDTMFAVKDVDYDFNGTKLTANTQNSYASLGSTSYYKMINEDNQGITSFYNYTSTQISGSEMDTYFRNSDWDPNYWYRYQSDMLPSLITYSESHIYYIYVASDLKNMVYYPDATFIVVGTNGDGIVKVGNYIRNTGLTIDNFSGVLKGYDSTGDYGFDFEGYSITFISSTTAGAKIYNLTIKNLGSASSIYQENVGSFVDQSIQTTFENLTFKNCQLYSSASSTTTSIGLMANNITGGYISNITFEDCSVNAKANANITNLNVGLMAGQISTQSNSYVQIYDVTAYLSNGNINNSILNDINVDVNGNTVTNLCVGTVAGKTTGSVMLYYTANSNTETRIKGIGVSGTSANPYTVDSSFTSLYNGIVIDVQDNNFTEEGSITNYNAGLVFGETNSLGLSFQRNSATLKLNIVGGLTNSGNVDIETANLGGALGKVANSVSISNSASFVDKYVNVDCDMNFASQTANAGMLIGVASTVYTIDNIDTYGTINIEATSTNGNSNIGGFVGKANGDITISNAVSRTKITVDDNNNSNSGINAVGGLVGLFNSTTSKMVIGDDSYNTKYLGTITISTNKVYAGGILGSATSTSSSVNNENGIKITSAVFGGNIIIEQTSQSYIGGMVGASNYNGQDNETKRLLENCLAYGNIYVNCDLAESTLASYVGGLLGKGSSFTYLNNNYSVATIFTEGTQTDEKTNINALVGISNGSKTNTNTNNKKYVNYYANQVSLCLDNNPSEDVDAFASQNVYYLTNNGTGDSTMLGVLTAYKSQLTQTEKLTEIYYGSKINPILITESNYSTTSAYFNDDFNGKAKYFVINFPLSKNKMQNITLKNSFIIGDGFALSNTLNAVFAEIDAKSVVSGIKVKAQISTTNTNTYNSIAGCGTLANVNLGTIYACNSNEQQSASVYGVYGIVNSNSGYVGGLVGVNAGYILDCYADVDVSGSSSAGGLVGYNVGLISNSYSTGNVVAPSAFAFSQGTGGEIYYCYTSSMVKGTSSGVFGGNTATGCYYDLYGTGVFQSGSEETIITSDTDTMAISVETEDKDVFLTNSTANIKFGYDFTKNFGYLTFIGEAYSDFSYMQNGTTGNGIAEDSAILIPNIGKLQQLNDTNAIRYYALINDITLTSDIEANGDIDYGIVPWKAIGINQATAFAGVLTGEYLDDGVSNNHTISGIASTTFENFAYGSIFGETNGAIITNLTIKDTNFENITNYIAGLISKANDTTITDVNIEGCNFSYTASGANNMGGIVASATGVTTIDNCLVSGNTTFNYGIENGSSNADSNIGGIVGNAINTVTISNSSVGESCQFNYLSSGSINMGALLGSGNGSESLNDQKINLDTCTVGNEIEFNYTTTESTSNTSTIGSIVGYSINVIISDIEMGDTYSLTYLANGESYMGGAVGFADTGTSISSVSCGETYTFAYTADTSTSSSYMGGVFGKAYKASINSTSISNAYSFNYSSNGTSYMGGLAGIASTVNLSSISYGTDYSFNFEATKAGNNTNYLGGLAGKIDEATIINSSVQTIDGEENWAFNYTLSDTLTVQNYLGGVAGYINNSEISGFDVKNIDFSGDKTLSALGENYLGGIAGYIANSTIETVNVKSCVNLCSYNGYVGGIAGAIENTQIGKIFEDAGVEISGDDIVLASLRIEGDSDAQIGGVVGKINTSTESKSIQNISIENCQVENPSLTAKVGGVVGLSESSDLSIKFITIDAYSSVKSNKIAGGILGTGSVFMIFGCSSSAEVSAYAESLEITGGTNDDTITPYAGGIVGKLISGTISGCDNVGSVSAGYNESLETGLISENDLRNMEDGVETQFSAGSNQSYAGGIVGHSSSSVIIEDSINYSSVTAKARITVAIHKQTYNFFNVNAYIAYGYLGGKVEKAYANGISYINNGTSVDSCSTNSSAIITGGDSVYWNMFVSTYDTKFYIIDYGYQNNSSEVYASWVAYDDEFYSGGIIGGARSVWENDFTSLYMVSNSYFGSQGIIIFEVCYPTIENLYYGNQICNNPNTSTVSLSSYLAGGPFDRLNSYGSYGQVTNCNVNFALNYPISMLGSLNDVLDSSITVLRNQSTSSNTRQDVLTNVGGLSKNYVHNDGGLGLTGI